MSKISTSIQAIKTAIITAVIAISFMATASASAQPASPFRTGTGDGTPSNPYRIATAADLATLAALVNAPATNAAFADKHYVLTSDIDLSGYANWTPIGAGLIRADGQDHHLTFKGVFDGAGRKISNLKITRADRVAESFQGHGLFGVVEGGTVRNVMLDGVSIGVDVGLVGGVAGAVIANSTITDCYVTGDIKGIGSVGGIVGHVDDNSAILNCYAVGDVSGADRVGGIAGHVYNSVITNSYVAGNVSESGVKGVSAAGHVWNSVITDSEVLDPQADAEKILAVIPEEIISSVVANERNVSPIVAVVREPSGNNITAGPNPVSRQSGAVNFYRHGSSIKRGSLSISNSMGKFVKRVSIVDNAGGSGWRSVGSWDLRDRRGQIVSEGSYIVRGTVVGADGKRERVSIILGVR